MVEFVIACPECDTRYRSDPSSIGPNGRTVRCARCKETWFVPAPDVVDTVVRDADALALADNEAADIAPIVEPVVETPLSVPRPTASPGADVMMRDTADAAKMARRRRTIWLIWLIPLAIVIAAVIAAYLLRQPIVNRIPQSATIYDAFGIETKQGGLSIDPPTVKTALVDGEAVVMVSSFVRNLSGEAKAVPLIELSLHDGAGETLAQWYVEPNSAQIGGKDRMEFATEYADPPVDAVGLRYKFADADI